jgi:hypothetical protein
MIRIIPSTGLNRFDRKRFHPACQPCPGSSATFNQRPPSDYRNHQDRSAMHRRCASKWQLRPTEGSAARHDLSEARPSGTYQVASRSVQLEYFSNPARTIRPPPARVTASSDTADVPNLAGETGLSVNNLLQDQSRSKRPRTTRSQAATKDPSSSALPAPGAAALADPKFFHFASHLHRSN